MNKFDSELQLEDMPIGALERIYSERLAILWYSLDVKIASQGPPISVHNRQKTLSRSTYASYSISRDIKYIRRRSFLDDGRDDLCIFVPVRGQHQGTTAGCEFKFENDSALLFRSCNEGVLHMRGMAQGFAARVPFKSFYDRLPWAEDVVNIFDLRGGILMNSLKSFCRNMIDTTFIEHNSPLQDTFIDILTLAFEFGRKEYSGDTIPWSFRQIAQNRIESLINENFSNQNLSPKVAAATIGISVRYIHKLMKQQETSFRARVMDCRLNNARLLLQVRPRALSIGQISFACGFSNQSYFSSVYKRRFGISPRDEAHL